MKETLKLVRQVQESLFLLQWVLRDKDVRNEKSFMLAFIGQTVRLSGIYLQELSLKPQSDNKRVKG